LLNSGERIMNRLFIAVLTTLLVALAMYSLLTRRLAWSARTTSPFACWIQSR